MALYAYRCDACRTVKYERRPIAVRNEVKRCECGDGWLERSLKDEGIAVARVVGGTGRHHKPWVK